MNYGEAKSFAEDVDAVCGLHSSAVVACHACFLFPYRALLCRGHDRYYRGGGAWAINSDTRLGARHHAGRDDTVWRDNHCVGRAIVLTVRFISHRLWKPFDEMLLQIEKFRLEDGAIPHLPESDVYEFARLGNTLTTLMQNSLASYRTQKEFTENASHELQTPLAVFQSKLDLLLQQPSLTERQAELIQALYETANRLARLNRNLLLLAKIDNRQYGQMEEIVVVEFLRELVPFLQGITRGINICEVFNDSTLTVRANRTLLESLVNNLVVNAVRHNRPGGEITIAVDNGQLAISNTSDEPALNKELIFNRFYRPHGQSKGNGLGLAIVKAVCEYHGWKVNYQHHDGKHQFTVSFGGMSLPV